MVAAIVVVLAMLSMPVSAAVQDEHKSSVDHSSTATAVATNSKEQLDASFVRIEKMRHQHFSMPVTQKDQSSRRMDRMTEPIAQRGVLLSRASQSLGDMIVKTLENTRENEFAKRDARMRIQERMRSAGLMWSGQGKGNAKEGDKN